MENDLIKIKENAVKKEYMGDGKSEKEAEEIARQEIRSSHK